MTDFFNDEIDQFSSNVGTIQTNHQLTNNESIKEVCQLQGVYIPKPNMACITPTASSKSTTNSEFQLAQPILTMCFDPLNLQ